MENHEVVKHQKVYVSKIKELSAEANHVYFKLLRAKLAWVTSSLPYIACPVAKLGYVVEETFESSREKYIRSLKDILELLINYIDVTPINKKTW